MEISTKLSLEPKERTTWVLLEDLNKADVSEKNKQHANGKEAYSWNYKRFDKV